MSQQEANDSLLSAEAGNQQTSAQRLEVLCTNPQLRIIVAGNPSAPTSLLERLAEDRDSLVRQAVANNPNTPWNILERLAWEFPHEFLSNLVGPLQIMARSEQITAYDEFWDTLLCVASLPSWWWSWLRSQPTLCTRPAMRMHVQEAGEATHPYGVPGEGKERDLLALVELLTVTSTQGTPLPPLPDRSAIMIAREHLQRLALSNDEYVREAVARNQLTPGEVLRILATDEKWLVQQRVAENPQTPIEMLAVLARDHNAYVQRHVAANPQTPAKVLAILALDQDDEVQRHVAANPQTPAKVLATLAMNQDGEVREHVARNPQVPEQVLSILAQDHTAKVRSAVAMHPQTSVEVLAALAQDDNGEVRQHVAEHAQTSVEVLAALALDDDDRVRSAVARNPLTSGEVLRTLAQDKDDEVREHVAEHAQTPPGVLQTLAWDLAARVRVSAIGNAQMPGGLLQSLRKDHNAEVRWLAQFVQSRFLGSEVSDEQVKWRRHLKQLTWIKGSNIDIQLNTLAKMQVPDTILQSILAVFAADWDALKVRTFLVMKEDAAEIPHAFPQAESLMRAFMAPIALQKLATSPHWEVRYLVALHEQTPWQVRQRLSQDGNRYVQAMAKAQTKREPSQ